MQIPPEVNQYGPQDYRKFKAHFELNPSALKHFTVLELVQNPELWFIGTDEAQKRHQWRLEAYPKHIVASDEIEDSILQCPKCKQRKVDYYQKQTRGADEPMTIFANCLHCGYRWRQ